MKRFKMRVFAGVLLTLMLVTLGDARSVRLERQSKGGPQVQESGIDHSQETEDDRVKDPDWLPTADDYVEDEEAYPEYDSYEETEDDRVKDPDWLPTADDYVEDEEAYTEYDSYEEMEEGEEVEDDDEDKLWSSDDDPDWKPEDHGYDDYDYGSEQVIDSDEDPDWQPTQEDYEDEDYEIDDDLDYEYGDAEYEDEDEEARLKEILFDIALLVVERDTVDAPDSDRVSEIFHNLTKLDLSIEDALEALAVLEAGQDLLDLEEQESQESQESQDSQEVDQTFVEVSPQQNQQVAGIIKTKRQTKSQNQISQITQNEGQGLVNGHIQQSGQNDQGEVGRVKEVNQDDVNKDPDWLPTADDYIEEEEEDYPEYDSYEETDEGEEVEDNAEDTLWSSDDDPDWKPEDHGYDDYDQGSEQVIDADEDPDWQPTQEDYEEDEDYEIDYQDDHGDDDDEEYDDEDEDTRLNEILFDMALLIVEKNAGDSPNSDQVFKVFQNLQKLDLSIEDALEALTLLQTEQDSIDQGVDQIIAELSAQQNQQVAGITKTKRQTKSQNHYVNGQIQQSGQNGRWEVGQGHQINQDDIAVGVEPLSPQVVANPYEVGTGVEAVDSGSGDDSSFFGWLGHGWGHVVDAANRVSDHVEETFDEWGNKISDATGNVQDAASSAVDAVQDAAHTAGESIVSTYHQVSGKIPELRERIRNLFTRFGVLVQRGADYCIQHMGQAVDQIKEAEVLDKLQQKLAEGNEQVIAFFQLVGEKVTSWNEAHGQLNVDSGLIIVPLTEGDDGQVVPQPDDDDEREQVVQQLDVYQDKEVVQYLNRLVSSGVLTQEEMDLLSQEQNQQTVDIQQQNSYQQQHSAIQVQSSLQSAP